MQICCVRAMTKLLRQSYDADSGKLRHSYDDTVAILFCLSSLSLIGVCRTRWIMVVKGDVLMQNGGDLYFPVKWLRRLARATRGRAHRMAWDLLVVYSRHLHESIELPRETLNPADPHDHLPVPTLTKSSREVRRAALVDLEKVGCI